MGDRLAPPVAKEVLNQNEKQVVFMADKFKLISPQEAFSRLMGLPDFTSMLPYLPRVIQRQAGYHIVQPVAPRNLDVDTFKLTMESLGENVLYGALPRYYGESNKLCMDLTSLMITYLSQTYGFPVVGLYNSRDADIPSYVRPVTTVMDRQPHYPEEAGKSGRFTLEDGVEVKIGESIFYMDFNYWYKHKEGNRVLIHDVSDVNKRTKMGKELGLWTTQFSGFTEQYMITGAREFYLEGRAPMGFLFNVGQQDLIQAYNEEGFPEMGDEERTHQWSDFFERHWHLRPTWKEIMQTQSTGALISAGYAPHDLSGRGRAFLVPENYHWKKILLELPLRTDMV